MSPTRDALFPEQIEALMRAARMERARAVRRALRALFHRRRNDDTRLETPVLSLSPCR